MTTNAGGCCGGGTTQQTTCTDSTPKETEEPQATTGIRVLIDEKTSMLIAAGAAVAANCEPCLDTIVSRLKAMDVADAAIRRAVEIGQMVKDKPAGRMKALADELTGSNLSQGGQSDGCSC